MLQQEALEQVARGRLRQPATLPLSALLVGWRIGGEATLEQGVIAREEVRALGRR